MDGHGGQGRSGGRVRIILTSSQAQCVKHIVVNERSIVRISRGGPFWFVHPCVFFALLCSIEKYGNHVLAPPSVGCLGWYVTRWICGTLNKCKNK